MDESGKDLRLEIEHRIAQSRKRMGMASKAGRVIDHAIATTEAFTPEEAIRLGCSRLLYTTEWQLYVEDLTRAEAELEEKDWGVPEELRTLRMEGEAILSAAIRGNFSPLKRDLKRALEGFQDYLSRPYFDFPLFNEARKLSELETAIPEKGQPFSPPPPSWEDPTIINVPDPGGGV